MRQKDHKATMGNKEEWVRVGVRGYFLSDVFNGLFKDSKVQCRAGLSLSELLMGIKSLGLILTFPLGRTKTLLKGHNVGRKGRCPLLDFLLSFEVGHPGPDLSMETIQGAS